MWNFVSSIQATLDEAAGINTREEGGDGEHHADNYDGDGHGDEPYSDDEGGADDDGYGEANNLSTFAAKGSHAGGGADTTLGAHSNIGGGGGAGWDDDDEDFDLDYGDDDGENDPKSGGGGDAVDCPADDVSTLVNDTLGAVAMGGTGHGHAGANEEEPASISTAAAVHSIPATEPSVGVATIAEEQGPAEDDVYGAGDWNGDVIGADDHLAKVGTLTAAEEQAPPSEPLRGADGDDAMDEEDTVTLPSPIQHDRAANRRTAEASDYLRDDDHSNFGGESTEAAVGGGASADAVVAAVPTPSAAAAAAVVSVTGPTNQQQQEEASALQHTKKENDRLAKENEAIVQQMLRLQSQLAEESGARAVAEERLAKAMTMRQKIEERVRLMKEQHAAALTAANKKGSQQQMATGSQLEALQQEGAAMSKQLGEERARTRELNALLKNCEKQVESLQQSLAAKESALLTANARLEEQVAVAKAASANVAAISSEATERDEALQEALDENEALQHIIDQLKANAATEIDEASAKESQLLEAFAEERNALMSEVDGLRLQLRRQALDHERELVAMEREVSAASERANAADLRAMDATRSINEATREMGGEMTNLADRANRLQDQLKERNHHIAMLNQQMREEREASTAAHRQEVEGLRAQLSSHTRDNGDATIKLQVLQEEVRREREQWRRREQGLAESIQELRAAVRSAANHSGAAASPLHSSHGAATSAGYEQNADSLFIASLVNGNQQQQQRNGGGGSTPSAAHPSSSAPTATATASSSTFANRYVEKELAKVSTELALLKTEHAQLAEAHLSLAHQHDVLLEMYGEKEEETMAMQEELDALRCGPYADADADNGDHPHGNGDASAASTTVGVIGLADGTVGSGDGPPAPSGVVASKATAGRDGSYPSPLHGGESPISH